MKAQILSAIIHQYSYLRAYFPWWYHYNDIYYYNNIYCHNWLHSCMLFTDSMSSSTMPFPYSYDNWHSLRPRSIQCQNILRRCQNILHQCQNILHQWRYIAPQRVVYSAWKLLITDNFRSCIEIVLFIHRGDLYAEVKCYTKVLAWDHNKCPLLRGVLYLEYPLSAAPLYSYYSVFLIYMTIHCHVVINEEAVYLHPLIIITNSRITITLYPFYTTLFVHDGTITMTIYIFCT